MPRRSDIKTILLIGSGPIVIGQACEFDYSGTQALKALKEEGYRLILANSNPATIMTDPEMAHATYIEPLNPEVLELIIAKEKPDAVLPTLGGQTALNLTIALAERGVFERHGVKVIGADIPAIMKAEKRSLFKEAMLRIGLDVPRSFIVNEDAQVEGVIRAIGLPAIVRPSYTLGGIGGGVAFSTDELRAQIARGLQASQKHEVIVEEYLDGWKEFELEVMRDHKDNVVIICSIENFDPMGVHTGDSITVAPAQTLTDKQYQELRDMSIAIMREIGVETGGSNIQFAVNPRDGHVKVIEMNPRVSRSSALASKATGFPIAKFAAKLAVGYSLDELLNDITRKTPACFEPAIDYVVTKIPRFAFEKFPQADPRLTSQMKSVGETMAIGRTFKESFQKALRGLEIGCNGFGLDRKSAEFDARPRERVLADLKVPTADRVFQLHAALKHGVTIEELHRVTGIDPWFLFHLRELAGFEVELLRARGDEAAQRALLRTAKRRGYSDRQLAQAWGLAPEALRLLRRACGVQPTYKMVDTCAGEFESATPYFYSTYEQENEALPSAKRKILIIGGGPNRIGQGIEFDYCCVHASLALRAAGFETIMVNSNPETVSTDYDISSRLYFEPVTLEDVLNIIELEKPEGVIVQFGGQTPLNLAMDLKRAGVPIIGTPPEQIEAAGNRALFKAIVEELGLLQPRNDAAVSLDEATAKAASIGYPVVVRPSFVLGGRAMEVVYNEADLRRYFAEAVRASPDAPVLLDRFLDRAIEVDVDLLRDTTGASVIGAVMEHIEECGIHSGDSACSIPPFRLGPGIVRGLEAAARALADRLKVVGLMNVQFAVREDRIYLIEVNPRASRTVPFVSKAIGVPLAKLASLVMVGQTLAELGFTREVRPVATCVKEVVLPFARFTGSDILLSPEMKSTGEVMGIAPDFETAYAKSQSAAGTPLPKKGSVFISVRDQDRPAIVRAARRLAELGFELCATPGTARDLEAAGVPVRAVKKIQDGEPNALTFMKDRVLKMIIMTSSPHSSQHEVRVRQLAILHDLPIYTTVSGAEAAVAAIAAIRKSAPGVLSLQEVHRAIAVRDGR